MSKIEKLNKLKEIINKELEFDFSTYYSYEKITGYRKKRWIHHEYYGPVISGSSAGVINTSLV
jgi:hypothetical protein